MNDTPSLRVRQAELAFLGEIGSEVSHEMRNVLSVIGEYAGLMDDLLNLAEKGKPLDQARLKKLAGNVTRQVKKGTEVMERFSRFAHAADEPTATFDLTVLTDSTVSLTQRHFARSGGMVHAELPDEEIAVTSSPFTVQHALFSAIQAVLESMESEGLVMVELADRGSEAAITVFGNTPAIRALHDRIAPLSAAVDELNGRVEETSTEERPALILVLPKA